MSGLANQKNGHLPRIILAFLVPHFLKCHILEGPGLAISLTLMSWVWLDRNSARDCELCSELRPIQERDKKVHVLCGDLVALVRSFVQWHASGC